MIGRYILQADIFDILTNQAAGSGNEIQLTDAMQTLLNKQKFYGKKFTGQRFDCGNPLGLLEANISYAKDLDAKSLTKILTNISK